MISMFSLDRINKLNRIRKKAILLKVDFLNTLHFDRNTSAR